MLSDLEYADRCRAVIEEIERKLPGLTNHIAIPRRLTIIVDRAGGSDRCEVSVTEDGSLEPLVSCIAGALVAHKEVVRAEMDRLVDDYVESRLDRSQSAPAWTHLNAQARGDLT